MRASLPTITLLCPIKSAKAEVYFTITSGDKPSPTIPRIPDILTINVDIFYPLCLYKNNDLIEYLCVREVKEYEIRNKKNKQAFN